uniref:Cytochrome c oxidase subunit 3 n=1 Tax=Allothyrus sp. LamingtonNP-QMS95173 TaxID=1442165 RepID=W0FHR1_9ACAR|nr:cytochrome oxidase c subunit 3 [Allothyrus sp. LamingtonNP-QMS95173]
MTFHPFHMVNKSPWPLSSSLSALMLTSGLIMYMHQNSSYLFLMAIFLMFLNMFQWWRDMIREATFMGNHTMIVIKGLKWGMILFIVSEIFFFISFFWSFFHSSLSPNIELGAMWPPMSIIPFNPFHIPLLNTTILLASGITVTWAHHNLLNKNFYKTQMALFMTVFLGIYFTCLQAWEYLEASFTISDSVFGSTFFVATGFHGLHVIIGTMFLFTCLMRLMKNHLSNNHHFGFEAAAWYWHFVDVVWLFLYMFVYWWNF